jgi:hypothetical protein
VVVLAASNRASSLFGRLGEGFESRVLGLFVDDFCSFIEEAVSGAHIYVEITTPSRRREGTSAFCDAV